MRSLPLVSFPGRPTFKLANGAFPASILIVDGHVPSRADFFAFPKDNFLSLLSDYFRGNEAARFDFDHFGH
jgi:hypothetical protein